MGKTITIIFILFAVLAACSAPTDTIVINEAESRRLFQEKSLSFEGKSLFALSDTDGQHLAYVYTDQVNNPESGVVEVRDSELELVSSFTLNRGKGPGEVLFPACLLLRGDKVFILDGSKKTIEMMNKQGEYRDTLLLQGNFSIFKWITPVVRYRDSWALAPVLPELLVKVDEKGEIIRSVPSWLKDNNDGRMWQEHACRITGDPQGNLYLSFNEDKFEMRKYDQDLNLIWARKYKDKIKPLPGMTMTVLGDAKQPVGTFVHSSFFYDSGKLYMLRGVGGQVRFRMSGREKERYTTPIEGVSNAFIDVFDAHDGSFLNRFEAPFVRTDCWSEVMKIGESFYFVILSGGLSEGESRPDNIVIKAVLRTK